MSNYHPTVNKIKDLLDQHSVNYKCFEHTAVRTSEEAAAIRPEYTIAQGAKALIVRIKKKGIPSDAAKQFVQVVVPGDARFNPSKARSVLQAKDIRFATEAEVAEITDGVEPGGVPPFGVLWGMPVYVEETLLQNDEIIYNAGDRRYSIAMSPTDYMEVVMPIVVSII